MIDQNLHCKSPGVIWLLIQHKMIDQNPPYKSLAEVLVSYGCTSSLKMIDQDMIPLQKKIDQDIPCKSLGTIIHIWVLSHCSPNIFVLLSGMI